MMLMMTMAMEMILIVTSNARKRVLKTYNSLNLSVL